MGLDLLGILQMQLRALSNSRCLAFNYKDDAGLTLTYKNVTMCGGRVVFSCDSIEEPGNILTGSSL